jgi:hypothetical protein
MFTELGPTSEILLLGIKRRIRKNDGIVVPNQFWLGYTHDKVVDGRLPADILDLRDPESKHYSFPFTLGTVYSIAGIRNSLLAITRAESTPRFPDGELRIMLELPDYYQITSERKYVEEVLGFVHPFTKK